MPITSIWPSNLLKGIDEIDLSVRSANCLKNVNITTLQDLVRKSEKEMLEKKNFGKKFNWGGL